MWKNWRCAVLKNIMAQSVSLVALLGLEIRCDAKIIAACAYSVVSQVCSGNGKCKGSGTRKGNGKCSCNKVRFSFRISFFAPYQVIFVKNQEYGGEKCDQCSGNHYESFRDETKLLCSPCHKVRLYNFVI